MGLTVSNGSMHYVNKKPRLFLIPNGISFILEYDKNRNGKF